MVQEKYIGIENELTSFSLKKQYNNQGFNYADFQNLLKDKYFKIADGAMRSSIGNGYYIDGSEIEIITPPIALNSGFATRLTNALILGRNYVIKNTPHMQHTGYSMHWNLSHDNNNFDHEYERWKLMNNLSIPFQLFGLTPLSCGFNVRTERKNNRYEVMGDSLINVDQINATALLLGAYSAATETKLFYKNRFPIQINELDGNTYINNNMLNKGRYSKIKIEINNKTKLTQAQNVLELFYEWLNPYVYKLGERDEINNLEAFIKGDKKLETDDIKYFTSLKKSCGLDEDGCYKPLVIKTKKGSRSQILQIHKNKKLEVPIEGELFGVYALNTTLKDKFITTYMNWNCINVVINDEELEPLESIDTMYQFAKLHHKKHFNKNYAGSLNTENILPKNIINNTLPSKLIKKIKYNPNKDLSLS
jgi:hypothetical protein